MKTVALISGGKDSCFNLLHCVAEGHHVVALGNLRPLDKDELDSYMYQTVGYHAIELYAEAMDLPLYRHTIQGTALGTERDYQPLENDEVEDLYHLLQRIKSELCIEAVSVGAILSDYQRVRVENVCARLGLVPLAYLWRRDQAELLQEMVHCGIEAILIKVAAMGLDPEKHLGLNLEQILPYMMDMSKRFGLNVCGEGGEYETFTLDCPLFKKRLVVDEKETVIHSADAFAPVGYIRFSKLHLEDKHESRSMADRVKDLPLTTSSTLMKKLNEVIGDSVTVDDNALTPCSQPVCSQHLTGSAILPSLHSTKNYFSVASIMALEDTNLAKSIQQAMDTLKKIVIKESEFDVNEVASFSLIENLGRTMSDIYSICLYLKNMADFATINSIYKKYFDINPPVRICVAASLPDNVILQLDCQGCVENLMDAAPKKTMHVQSISHWAPANIGPYSQAIIVNHKVYISGQIPLVPGTMQLVSGGIRVQALLSLNHVQSILQAMCPGMLLSDSLLCICYVVNQAFIRVAREQWELACSVQEGNQNCNGDVGISHKPLVEYVVVPSLPRGASVEWQVYTPAERVDTTENEETHACGRFMVHSRTLTCADNPNLFSSKTNVLFQSSETFDCKEAVTCCLNCYGNLLIKLEKKWSDVPLLRIFYPAWQNSYESMYTAWKHILDAKTPLPPSFCIVPVKDFDNHTNICMSVCH